MRGTFLTSAKLVIAFALALLTLSGCDRDNHEVVTLRYWNGFTGPDGRAMLALVKQFNSENPDINVVMQRMEWGTYYNKLFVAGLGGRAPDVFISHSYALKRFMAAGFVRQVDDMFGTASNQLDPSDFDSNILANLVSNGHHWGVPLDVHPLGMFYNKTLFRQAGIVDAQGNPQPPRTREEFIDALRKLRDPQSKRWGFVFTWQRTNCYTLVRQFGGRLFDDTGTRPSLNLPQNAQALDFARHLISENLVPAPQDFNSWIGFRQGKVGIVFEGIYMLPELKRQKDLDWGAAPVPQLGIEPAAWGESHSMVLRAGLDARHEAAAKRLVKFLSDHSLTWAAAGQVPVRKSLRDSAEFRALYAQSQFARQIPYIAYLPKNPFVFEFLTEFDLAVELSLRGTLPPDRALAQAQQKVQRVVDRYRTQGWDLGDAR